MRDGRENDARGMGELMNTQELFIWALCVWREAMGEGFAGMLGVAWVMENRLNSGRWGKTMHDVIEDPLQFSSMTAKGDPMTVKWPNSRCEAADLAAWQEAQRAVSAVISAGPSQDPTNGAEYYFNPEVVKPDWAAKLQLVATIGHHEFLR